MKAPILDFWVNGPSARLPKAAFGSFSGSGVWGLGFQDVLRIARF